MAQCGIGNRGSGTGFQAEEMSQEENDHACEEVEVPNTVKAQVRLRCSFGSIHQWKNRAALGREHRLPVQQMC